MPLLKAEALTFSYGPQPLISDLSFELRRGDLMCVLGPNGCGKSTLLKLLTGYIKAAGGAVKIKGQQPASMGPVQLARLAAFVPSETSTPYDFSVGEAVLLGRTGRAGFWRGYARADHAAAALAMEETGITRLAPRSINTLSTGERQLVFIAQALAQETSLLLLDEPTSHLDLKYKAVIMALLGRLAAKGMAVAAVLHEPALARLGCNKALLLRGGGEFSFGPAAEMLSPENLALTYGLPPDSPLLSLAAGQKPRG
ncbi:MAG TPA: ABC transporter ATP-binding protein [Elusimicrobiales bacterium]|nr:ABC transporter ATP-binding protein [Elusimicrobiales bacterium]